MPGRGQSVNFLANIPSLRTVSLIPSIHQVSTGWLRLLSISGMVLVAALLSVLSITPKLVPWRDHPLYMETSKVPAMVEQLANPGGWDRAHLAEPGFDGIQSIRWRLLPPVAGNALHLSPGVYLTMPWLGLLVLLGMVIHYALLRGATTPEALSLGILVGTSSAFFSSSCAIGYFDPFYLIAIVAACYSPSTPVFLGACLLGPWVDEKFLLMLPLCSVVRWTWKPGFASVRQAALAISPYCLIRLVALYFGDGSVSRQIGIQSAVFFDYARAPPEAWWYGFRAGWIVIVAGLWTAARALDDRGRLLLFSSLIAAVASVTFLAWDTTRSIAMLVPLMLLGPQPHQVKRALPWLAVLNLILPAAYVWCGHPVTVPLKSVLKYF